MFIDFALNMSNKFFVRTYNRWYKIFTFNSWLVKEIKNKLLYDTLNLLPNLSIKQATHILPINCIWKIILPLKKSSQRHLDNLDPLEIKKEKVKEKYVCYLTNGINRKILFRVQQMQ